MVLPFLAFPNGAKLVINWTSEAGEWSNILWFSKTSFSLADLEDLAAMPWEPAWSGMAALLNDSVHLNNAQAYDMRSIDGAVVTADPSDLVGSNAGDILPLQNALVITLRTAARGRAYRGRIYVSGIVETFQDGGVYIGDALTDALEYFLAIRSQASTFGWAQGVASRQLDHVLRTEGVITPLIDMDVRSAKPGSQRRRTRRP